MVSTRAILEQVENNLDDSMGIRSSDSGPRLSPVPSPKDVGRRPLRSFGRVEIDRVAPDPAQPRCEFSDEAIAELAASIREKGQPHPIRVRWDEAESKWVIVSGERRWRATKEAGLPTIDCFFHDGAVSESETLEQQLIEYLLREDLKPIEEAKAFSSLMDLNGWNGKQVANALHLPEWRICRSLALLDLPPETQIQVDAGKVAARTAYEITKLPDEESRRKLAKVAAQGKLSHKQAVSAVRQRRGKPAHNCRGTKQTFFADGGWRVTVSSKTRGTYDDMEVALTQALEEVRHYIAQGRSVM